MAQSQMQHKEFLTKLAELCKEYKAGIEYTSHSGIVISFKDTEYDLGFIADHLTAGDEILAIANKINVQNN